MTSKKGVLNQHLKKSYKTFIVIGIPILFVGIMGIVYPVATGKIATIAIGIFLVVSGLFRLSFAFFSATIGMAILRYLMAILILIAGVWTIGNPEMGLELLTMILAIFFIIDGLTQIGYSLSLMPIGGGLFFLFGGIITVILGILIFSRWPESSNYVLGLYVGIKLIFDGIALLLTGLTLRKVAKSLPN